MIFDFFAKALNIFLLYKKEAVEHESDMVHIRKRQLLHKDIPNLDEIKVLTGERFYKLQKIFIRFDPIKHPRLSKMPNKYELLTKTVIYKLPTQKNRETTADLLYVEFSLWFKHTYNDFENKDDLIDEVFNFKKKYFPINPFDSNTIK